MIQLVIVTEGTAEDKEKANKYFKTNPGWKAVSADVWLVATRVTVQAWRDFLAREIPNLKFLIVRSTSYWGESGLPNVAQWLKAVGGWF